jgi:hypothetical protein
MVINNALGGKISDLKEKTKKKDDFSEKKK